MPVRHAKVSAVADDADSSTVSPSDWNADHIVDSLVLTGGSPTISAATGRPAILDVDLTGDPRAPTTAITDNDTSVATTAFVQAVAAAMFSTGDVKLTLKVVADSGWVMFDDGTIGSASSGSSYANAAAQALFLLLYANTVDASCPILTSAGGATTRAAQGAAATAWAANCRMTLPKALGRALAGAGSGSGLTAHPLGSTGGAETVTQTIGTLVSHGHNVTPNTPDLLSYYPPGGYNNSTIFSGPGFSVTTTILSCAGQGGGGAMGIVQPTTFLNVMVKL
jgi:hypothetical protein